MEAGVAGFDASASAFAISLPSWVTATPFHVPVNFVNSSFAAFSPGRYTASLWLEVVGGKSWELVCPTAEVEIAP